MTYDEDMTTTETFKTEKPELVMHNGRELWMTVCHELDAESGRWESFVSVARPLWDEDASIS